MARIAGSLLVRLLVHPWKHGRKLFERLRAPHASGSQRRHPLHTAPAANIVFHGISTCPSSPGYG